jgi:hypothetical protein
MEDEKPPFPDPAEILLSEVVGVKFVELQQNPFDVTSAPPSEVTSPIAVAEVDDILFIDEAVTVGSTRMFTLLQLEICMNINTIRRAVK